MRLSPSHPTVWVAYVAAVCCMSGLGILAFGGSAAWSSARRTGASEWARLLGEPALAVVCVGDRGPDRRCTVRTAGGLYPVVCFVGCSLCRPAVPGDCVLEVAPR